MDITPVDSLPTHSPRKASAATTQLFENFLASGSPVVKVVLGEDDKKLPSVRSSLQNYIKNNGLNVKVVTRANDLYLVREDAATDNAA